MDYHIINVQENRLDELSLSITLELHPTLWEKWIKKVPMGKTTYIGYNRKWYSSADYKPASSAIVDILFDISYDRAFRHLQPKQNNH